MNGIIYCRVSSKEQVEGTSLDSQEQACRDYAVKQHIGVLKIFVEQGESAKFADRTQLAELLSFCRANPKKVDVLLVWKLDRFARNVTDHFSIKAMLLKYGVRVVSVTEPIDANPEGKLLETILAGFAQFDNDIRALRTVQGMRRKYQEGIFPTKPPLGYEVPKRPGKKKTLPDVPKQPLFGLLQRAWRELITGQYTKAEIRRLMTSWGITTRAGTPLSPQAIDRFFSNPFYAGILVDPWSKDRYQGLHVPLVTAEEFARAQEIVERRNRSLPHRKARPEVPLRGTVRCTGCRHLLTGSLSRGRSRRYAYYHCAKRQCIGPRIYAAARVHDEFTSRLAALAPRPGVIVRLGEMIVEAAQVRAEQGQAVVAQRKEKLAKIERYLRELVRMRADGLLDDREFIAEKVLALKQRAALEGSATARKLDPEAVRGTLEALKAPLSSLRQTWQRLAVARQGRFQQMLFPVGFVAGNIGTAQLPHVFRLFEQLADPNTRSVALADVKWNQIIAEITAFSEFFESTDDPVMALLEAVPRKLQR